jgi:hypothetical protein
MSVLRLGSCNTFGATFYTDGYVAGDMYAESCLLNICPCCGEYFWLEDAKPRTGDGVQTRAAVGLLPPAEGVRQAEYEKALHAEPWKSPGQELYLRIRAWWWSNMPYRDQSPEPFQVAAQDKANLMRLLQLLDEDDGYQRLMRAEIFRELGLFELAIDELGGDFDDRYGGGWTSDTRTGGPPGKGSPAYRCLRAAQASAAMGASRSSSPIHCPHRSCWRRVSRSRDAVRLSTVGIPCR